MNASRHTPGCHAQKRAKSRYGLRLFAWQLDALADDIRAGRALATFPQTHSKWICLIDAGGLEMVAVYCRRTRRILTFLPSDSDARRQLEEQRSHARPNPASQTA